MVYTKINMTKLWPAPGYCLVELGSYTTNLPSPEQKYNRHTSGICVEGFYIGRRIFWEELQASEIIEHEGKKYCFVKEEDVRGYETSEETD